MSYSGVNPDNKSEELSVLISDAVNFRNDLIARVNNPDGKDNPKIIKAYYKAVEKDLLVGVDKLFTRLSALTVKRNSIMPVNGCTAICTLSFSVKI